MKRHSGPAMAGALLALCLAAGGSIPRPSAASSVGPAGEPAGSTKWTLAVVVRRGAVGPRYVGSVRDPRVPEAIQGGAAYAGERVDRRPPADPDYEIWLVASGRTLGLRYSSRGGVYTIVMPGGREGSIFRDSGEIRQIVARAAPARADWARPVPNNTVFCYLPPPAALDTLCHESMVIAVGTVAGIVRVDHCPVNSTGPQQHTVYAVAVERYLKADAPQPPPIIKVTQVGGWLPWKERTGGSGVGFGSAENPMLTVGARYCLFLARRPYPIPSHVRRLGFVLAMEDGVWGKGGELDEYSIVDHWRAKMLLAGGVTRAPGPGESESMTHWRFERGPQILDVREEQALAIIQQAVAAEAAEQQ